MRKDAISVKAAAGVNVIKTGNKSPVLQGFSYIRGEITMRLKKLQATLKEKSFPFTYAEEDGCGSVDFEYRGVAYHVWEFFDTEWGAETNVFRMGRHEDIYGNYEEKILEFIKNWN